MVTGLGKDVLLGFLYGRLRIWTKLLGFRPSVEEVRDWIRVKITERIKSRLDLDFKHLSTEQLQVLYDILDSMGPQWPDNVPTHTNPFKQDQESILGGVLSEPDGA